MVLRTAMTGVVRSARPQWEMGGGGNDDCRGLKEALILALERTNAVIMRE